jgi:L-ascorbate metabolism protein UlaG (beta-lactamase superfamily)
VVFLPGAAGGILDMLFFVMYNISRFPTISTTETPMKALLIGLCMVGVLAMAAMAEETFEKDVIHTSAGNVEVTFIGHGTLLLTWNGKNIHIDPWNKLADYTKLPKADVILLTHEHQDHTDLATLEQVRTKETLLVMTARCAEKVPGGTIMKNDDVRTVLGMKVEAVPAYNIVHKRENGQPFHPKGEGNGYVLTFGRTRVYVAGDTENIPEMKALKKIDIAFLPMNLPYTMTPEMVADAAKAFKPKVLYPYHYGETDPSRLVQLLKETPGVEVRIRKMR